MSRLSLRTGNLLPSPVREMLSLAQQPGMISFAGGLPAFESFADLELPPPPRSLLQYGPSEGEPELRVRIAEELRGLGLDSSAERVLILSGSQQGIDLAAKLVVDAGTPVAAEELSYLAALQVFRFFGARLVTFEPSRPLAAFEREKPALAYINPTFQNPTGRCWSAAERVAMAEACDATDTILFEDDPYRDLAYEPCERRPVCAYLERASWIYQGSFSKTVAPGLRLGFLAASADLFVLLVRAKQAADLHTNRLSQWLVLQYLNDPDWAARLGRVTELYRGKRDYFADSLRRHLGGRADWSTPPGGLFFWLRLADIADSQSLLEAASARGVLFTPGRHFLAGEGGGQGSCAAIRLNFSQARPEAIDRGLAILGELLAR